jgi:GntR family transcriptional regulator
MDRVASLAENFGQVVAEFAHSEVLGIPKHVRLKHAILKAIREGYLKPGDQLPPEQEVSRAIGLSLGTVQRALNSLANDRAVTREQGRGTFVSKPELSVDDLWQYRFVERHGGVPLPIRVELLTRRVTFDRQSWHELLGHDKQGYCELSRLVTVNKQLRCLSRFYFRVSRFPTIAKMSKSEIPPNLKRFLAQKLDAATHSVEQIIRPCAFEKEICSLLKIKRSAGMLVQTVGRSVSHEAITFQSFWIPETKYFLEISPGKRPAEFRFGIPEES